MMARDQRFVDEVIAKYVGLPFVHNGRDPKSGVDCLGLIHCLYKDLGIDFPADDGAYIEEDWYVTDPNRYLRNLLQLGVAVEKSELQKLDLVYFYIKGTVRHAGIMTSETTFIHTLQNRYSRITRLARYWDYAFAGARRLI